MKKLFRPVKVIKKQIDISVNIDDYRIEDPAAETRKPFIRKPFIRKPMKISEEALSLYINFLNCVLHIIWSHGLKITKQYWAKKTYTYNIEAKHCGHIGNEKIKYNIQFRVNNHINQTLNRGPKFDGSREMTMPALQDIRVGKFEPSIYPDAMLYINIICKEIKENHKFTEGTPAT